MWKKRIWIFVAVLIATWTLGLTETFAEEETDQTTQETEATEKAVPVLAVEEEEIHVVLGETLQLNVEHDGDGSLVYESAEDDVVTVEEDGMITACKAGETVVTIRVEETEEYQEAETTVKVIVDKKTQTITASDMVISYGAESMALSVEVLGDAPLSYDIADSSIAEVDENGSITPEKVGKTILTITATETEEYQAATCELTVTVKTTLAKPAFTRVSCEKGIVSLFWEKVEGAEGYYLYEKISGENYRKIAIINDPDVLEYVTEIETTGTTYSYIVRAFTNDGDNISDNSTAKQAKYLLAPTTTVRNAKAVAEVKWTQVTGASGYYIYRREEGVSEWTQVAEITSGTTLVWTDNTIANGKRYYYTIKGYYKDSLGDLSAEKSAFYLTGSSVSITRKSKSTKMTVKWSKNTAASGYQIQYATNRLFHSAKTITISGNGTTSKTITKLSKKKTYYVRVRSFVKIAGKTYYSVWTESSNAKATKSATSTILKRGKKTFELRGQAKQTLYQYDTVQGGCSDGTYAYYVLYNRNVEKCKIAKVKLSNMKVVKVSGVLNIAHGNDMTYNSSTKRLMVTHTEVDTKRISIINPSTLKVEKSVDVEIPAKLTGVSDKELKNVKGFCGIAYNAKRKQYVTFLKSTGDLMILDSNFNPVSYIKPQNKSTLTKQGMDVTDDYILLGYSGATNIIMVYTWDGELVSKINLKKGYELENIYHVGSQYYATYYRSYYKTYYKTVKKVKVVNGKKKTVKVKQKYKKLMRDNYVYKISGF